MEIKNKTFVITGAGSGIGRQLTLKMVLMGAEVAAIDINKEGLEETKKLAGKDNDKISVHILNITDKKAVQGIPNEILKNHKQIDGLINNAGIIQPFVKINDLDYETIDKVMKVNFYGTLYMTKAFLPILLKRPEGYIANVSSMGGFLPVPGQSIYGASKAAVKLFSEGLYAELKNTKVHVSVIFPGATDTNISKNSKVETPQKKCDEPEKQNYPTQSAEKAADCIIHGIENNLFQVFAGKDAKFMNNLYRLNPKYATDYITEQMKDLLCK